MKQAVKPFLGCWMATAFLDAYALSWVAPLLSLHPSNIPVKLGQRLGGFKHHTWILAHLKSYWFASKMPIMLIWCPWNWSTLINRCCQLARPVWLNVKHDFNGKIIKLFCNFHTDAAALYKSSAVFICFVSVGGKEREPFSRCVGASRHMSRRAGVMDVAPSHVVVKAGLRNLLLRVYRHLMGRNIHVRIRQIVKPATHTQTLLLQNPKVSRPWGCIFQGRRQWCRSTDSRCRRCRCHSNQDSTPVSRHFG